MLTMVSDAERVRLSEVLRCSRLSSPTDRSNRLRGAMRAGLWSSFWVLGEVSVSSEDENCEHGTVFGGGGVKKRATREEKTICAVKLWTGGMSRRPSKPGTLELYQPMGKVMGVAPRTEKS